jgi:hypothetical protein
MSRRKIFLIAFGLGLAAMLALLIYACFMFLRAYSAYLLSPGYSLGVPANGILLTVAANVSSTIAVPLLMFAMVWFRFKVTNEKLYWLAAPVLFLFGIWLTGWQYPNANKKLYTFLWHVQTHQPEKALMDPDELIVGAYAMTLPEQYDAYDSVMQLAYDKRDTLIKMMEKSASDSMLDAICGLPEAKILSLDRNEFNRTQPIEKKNWSIEYYKSYMTYTIEGMNIYTRLARSYEIQIMFTWSFSVLMVLLFLLGRLLGRLTRTVHLAIIFPAVFLVLWFVLGNATLIFSKLATAEKLSPALAAFFVPIGVAFVVVILYWVDWRARKKLIDAGTE